jgi:hypothetical protein
MAATREAEALTDRLAQNGAAGVENSLDHGGVLIGHIAVQQRGAVLHGHAGDRDIVLDGHGPPDQRPTVGPLDPDPPGPGPEPVLLGPGGGPAVPRPARLPLGLPELVEPVIGGQEALDQRLEGGHPLFGDDEVELAGDRGEVVGYGTLHGHGYPQGTTAADACLRVPASGVNAFLAQYPPDRASGWDARGVHGRCCEEAVPAR